MPSAHPLSTAGVLAMRVVTPSRQQEATRPLSLVTAMHSLVTHVRRPIALEIVQADQRRGFQVRAKDTVALTHLATQLRTRYPQAELHPVVPQNDPLRLESGEAASVWELRTGAAPYLPLQTFAALDDAAPPEHDPLLGILAALDAVPAGMRAVCQLILVPVSATWSRRFQRKGLEHALDPERLQRQQLGMQVRTSSDEYFRWLGSTPILLLCVLFLLVAFVVPLLPSWVGDAFFSLLGGRWPTLSPSQHLLLIGGGILSMLVLGLCAFGLSRLFRRPMYDMNLVAAHVSRVAYRARLRLIVIGPRAAVPLQNPMQGKPLHRGRIVALLSTLWTRVCIQWASFLQGIHLRRQRRHVLAGLAAAYRAFDVPGGNYLRPRRCSPHVARTITLQSTTSVQGHVVWKTRWWRGVRWSSMLLSVDTLAALWHLPSASLTPDLAGVEHRRRRTLLISPALADITRSLPPMGISEHGGHRVPFRIPPQCLTQHMLIIGKSGEGKSTCQEHLAQAAMENGGLVMIDPHGDLVENVLRQVPPHRASDVILIDLADEAHSFGFNPLDATIGKGRDKAISDLLKTLSHIWVSAWGPRMENAFEYALRTLYDANRHMVAEDAANADKQYTLLDVMSILTDESFCHALLEKTSDPFIKRWWYTYFDPLSPVMQRERSDPVLSKVAKFENQIARRIIGQSRSSIHFLQAIQEEKILLIKLAKGEVGEDMARLLGATFLGLLQIALQEQGRDAEAQRKRLGILVDEFQALSGVDWAAIAELRKYGAAFYLATQSLEYLRAIHPLLLPVVLSNVKQYILFHMSAQDAETMAAEAGITADDLIHMDGHGCFLSLRYKGERFPTFSATFSLPDRSDEQRAEAIREHCRRTYTQPAADVDTLLTTALIRTLATQPRDKLENQRKTVQVARMNSEQQGRRARQDDGFRGRKSQGQRRNEQGQSTSTAQAQGRKEQSHSADADAQSP